MKYMIEILYVMLVIIISICLYQAFSFVFRKTTIGGGNVDTFDAKEFVSKNWEASLDGVKYEKITKANWNKFKQSTVYFRNGEKTMLFNEYRQLQPSGKTDYMIKYKVDKHALGDNAFLMSPFLRLWQNQNIYPLIKNGKTLFDIGVGDGRSRDLWLMKHLTVYGVEPGDHIQRLIKRNLPRVIVKQTGGEDPSIKTWVPQVDYVMMSYSITFFYKNQDMFESLVNNLTLGDEILIIGMDGDVVDKWPAKIDNHLMRFEKLYKDKIKSPFGKEIKITIKSPTTLVEDQTEYLVDFSVLIAALKNKGYKVLTDVNITPPVYFGDAAEFIKAQRFIHFIRT